MIDIIKTKVVPLIQEMVSEFQEDNVPVLSASMAYFAIFSLFPLLLVILSIIGLLIGNEDSVFMRSLDLVGAENAEQAAGQIDVNAQIFEFLSTSVSPDVAQQIETILGQLNANGVGASLIGFAVLLWSASNIFGQLDRAFQVIWDIEKPDSAGSGIVGGVLTFARKKLFAFGLVVFAAVMILISMLSGVVLDIISSLLPDLLVSGPLWQWVHFGVSFALLMLVFLLLFKYIPDARLKWSDVWMGAVLSTVLFVLLSSFSTSIIGGGNYQAYGAVGSSMVFLLWVFFSSMIIFIGAEFSQVYTRMYGSMREVPADKPELQALAAAAKRQLTAEVLAEADLARGTAAGALAAQVPAPPAPTKPPFRSATQPQTLAIAAGLGVLTGMVTTLLVSVGALVVGVRKISRLWNR